MMTFTRSSVMAGLLVITAITPGCARQQQTSAAAETATAQQLQSAYAALVQAGDADSLAAA